MMKVISIISIIGMRMEITILVIVMKITIIKVTIIFRSSDYRCPTHTAGGSWQALGGRQLQ